MFHLYWPIRLDDRFWILQFVCSRGSLCWRTNNDDVTGLRVPANLSLVHGVVGADAVHLAEIMIRRRNSDAVRQVELRLLMVAGMVVVAVGLKPAWRLIRWGFCADGVRVLVRVLRQVLLVSIELAVIVAVLFPDGRLQGSLRRTRRYR